MLILKSFEDPVEIVEELDTETCLNLIKEKEIDVQIICKKKLEIFSSLPNFIFMYNKIPYYRYKEIVGFDYTRNDLFIFHRSESITDMIAHLKTYADDFYLVDFISFLSPEKCSIQFYKLTDTLFTKKPMPFIRKRIIQDFLNSYDEI